MIPDAATGRVERERESHRLTVRDNTSPENPWEYYRPAGNITAGGRERSLDCFKAPR